MSTVASARTTGVKDMTLIQAINAALHEEMERDECVITYGQGIRGRVYGTATGLVEKFGPSRVRDTPISEPAEVGMAVGAAMTGLRPVVDLNIATFVYLAMDQIVDQAAKYRYMFGGQTKVPLVIRCGMGYGTARASHHSDRPYPLLMNIPGLKIVVPSSPAEMKGLLKSAIRDDDPVICFEDSSVGGKEPVPLGEHLIPIGLAHVKRPGKHVTVVAVAAGVTHTMRAAETLATEGIDVEVIDVRSVKPIDTATILESSPRTASTRSERRSSGSRARTRTSRSVPPSSRSSSRRPRKCPRPCVV